MSRTLVRGLLRLMVVALLLGQFAIASHACPALRHQTADVGPRSEAGIGCDMSVHDAVVVAGSFASIDSVDADASNLCAEHCKYGQQSDQTTSTNVPFAAPSASFRNNPPLLVESRLRPTASAVSALVSACPPHAILHCVRRS